MLTIKVVAGAPLSEVHDTIASWMAGGKPANVTERSFEEAIAVGRADNCSCGLIECVCDLVGHHQKSCRFRRALLSPVSIACDHGLEACSECDPCNCL